MKRFLVMAALVLGGVQMAQAGSLPVPDMACSKFKETGAPRSTQNIVVDGNPCVMKLPAKQICVSNAFFFPAAAGQDRGLMGLQVRYACYKAKCPKAKVDVTVNDRFASHTGTAKAPNVVCFSEALN